MNQFIFDYAETRDVFRRWKEGPKMLNRFNEWVIPQEDILSHHIVKSYYMGYVTIRTTDLEERGASWTPIRAYEPDGQWQMNKTKEDMMCPHTLPCGCRIGYVYFC